MREHRESPDPSSLFFLPTYYKGVARLSFTARIGRAVFYSLPVFSEAAGVVSIARIERPPLHRGGSASTETMLAVSRSSSKLACVPSLGWTPMLVYVWPSNEHILIVRVPGAQDQCGCPSNPFIVGALRAQRPCQPSRDLLPSSLIIFSGMGSD